jgi:hypothetical protein
MICVSRGPAFGPCGWPNASGGERMAAAPALEHFCPAPRQDQAVQATCFRRSSAPSPSVLDSASNPLTGVRCSGSYRDRGAAKQLQIRGPHILLGEVYPVGCCFTRAERTLTDWSTCPLWINRSCEIRAPRSSLPCRLPQDCERRAVALGRRECEYRFYVEFDPPLPSARLGLIVGDGVRGLRSALDHCVYAIGVNFLPT